MRRIRAWGTRRRLLFVAALTLAVGLAAGGIAAATHRGGHGIEDQIVLTVIEKVTDEGFVDADPPATNDDDVSPGDTFFFAGDLWNRAETRIVGSDQGMCTFLFDFMAHCQATFFLPGGTVQGEGAVDFGEDAAATFFVAVTGGTERYENVVGEIRGTQIEGTDNVRFRFELIPSFKRP